MSLNKFVFIEKCNFLFLTPNLKLHNRNDTISSHTYLMLVLEEAVVAAYVKNGRVNFKIEFS